VAFHGNPRSAELLEQVLAALAHDRVESLGQRSVTTRAAPRMVWTQPHQFGNSTNYPTVAEPLTVVAIDLGSEYPAPLGKLWLPRHRCSSGQSLLKKFILKYNPDGIFLSVLATQLLSVKASRQRRCAEQPKPMVFVHGGIRSWSFPWGLETKLWSSRPESASWSRETSGGSSAKTTVLRLTLPAPVPEVEITHLI